MVKGVLKTNIPAKKVAEKRLQKTDRVDGEKKKSRRFRPGTVALREIKRYQSDRETDPVLRRAPFNELVHVKLAEIAKRMIESKDEADPSEFSMRTTANAVETLRLYIQEWNTKQLDSAQDLAIHSRRVRVYRRDLEFLRAKE